VFVIQMERSGTKAKSRRGSVTPVFKLRLELLRWWFQVSPPLQNKGYVMEITIQFMGNKPLLSHPMKEWDYTVLDAKSIDEAYKMAADDYPGVTLLASNMPKKKRGLLTGEFLTAPEAVKRYGSC